MYQVLCKAKTRWKDVGINLGIGIDELNSIEAQHKSEYERCIQDMVTEWLRQIITYQPSWQKLVEALMKIDQSLASKVQQEYLGLREGALAPGPYQQSELLGTFLASESVFFQILYATSLYL